MNLVNGYAKTFGLKEEVTTKMKNVEGHVKLGLIGGLGINIKAPHGAFFIDMHKDIMIL